MDMTKILSAGAVALLAGLTLSLAPPSGETESSNASPVVSHQFRSSLVNGMGVSSLSDLNGKPVLVEFWGTR